MIDSSNLNDLEFKTRLIKTNQRSILDPQTTINTYKSYLQTLPAGTNHSSVNLKIG